MARSTSRSILFRTIQGLSGGCLSVPVRPVKDAEQGSKLSTAMKADVQKLMACTLMTPDGVAFQTTVGDVLIMLGITGVGYNVVTVSDEEKEDERPEPSRLVLPA